ncbi:MAG: LamG-like jellyroll fold domain-containing protein [Armatimonadota bacterium]
MVMRVLVLLAVLAAVTLPGLAAIPERATPFDLQDAAAVGKAFTPEQAEAWKVTEDGYGGPGDGSWRYALAGNETAMAYRFTAMVKLVKPATQQDGMELGRFAVFNNLANLGGYEAGVLVGYQSPEKYYRIAISSLWKEVVVWTPTAGIIAVAPYDFQVGKSYKLSVGLSQGLFDVFVNDKALINPCQAAEPILQGKVGLALKEGESYFTQAALVDGSGTAKYFDLTHVPNFREQQWHNMRWFFDGNEPVCTLLPSNVYDLMKFRPGYRPLLYAFNYITDWNRFYPSKITDYKLVEQGKRLVIETKAVDAKTKAAITQDARMVITYDAATKTYRYDHSCVTHLSAEEADKVVADWDHGDSVFLGGVGSSVTRDPKADMPRYQWGVFESTDGKLYKVPYNHNGHFQGTADTHGGPLKPGGAGLFPVGDPVLSPVVQIPEMSPQIERTSVGHCWWAYDMHTMFTLKKVDGKIPAGDFTTRVVYSGMEAQAAQAMLAKAEFYKPGKLDVKVPLYTAGTGLGFVEPFDTVALLAAPTGAHRIWAGVIDDTVGHGDQSSLRLDGPTEAWTLTGASYFTGVYAKKVRVSAWVKTKDVAGEGPAFGFHRMDNEKYEFHTSGLTGTKDWTKISYVSTLPAECWGVHLFWRNSGTGTVWFDDFQVEALEDTAAVEPPARVLPLKPADTDIVLKWADQGDAGGVLDLSGYGHHGKFFGDITWAEEDGKRVLVLGDKGGYIWPLQDPNLTLGPDSTLVFDSNPTGGGFLVQWGFAFNYIVNGGGPKFPLLYQARGKNVPSEPVLTAGAWQKLVIVVTKDKITLYVNGKPAGEMAAVTFPGNPNTFLNTTWHRHLSLFGAGPGDISLVPQPTHSAMKGKVRGVTVYQRALTAEEVGKL